MNFSYPTAELLSLACIRRELSARFEAAGLNTTRLPLNAGPSDPHVPILTSSNLATAKRLIVYFGESMQDLGIFAHRIIGQESITSGSALDFVHAIQSREDSTDTAIVIANLGQLVWYRRGQRAMTIASWNALPRTTGVGNPMRIDAIKNHAPGNRNVKEHVESVFEEVLGKLARQDAAISLIGLGEGAEEAVGYLDQNWRQWEAKVKAICVGVGFVWRVGDDIQNEKFMGFWGKVSPPSLSLSSIAPAIRDHADGACPLARTCLPHPQRTGGDASCRSPRARLQLLLLR